MSKITAEVIADSICNGHRITTMLLTYPRFIHSEMCRHRMFSRNTASSRAIPFEKMVEAVKNDPVIPIAWQKHHKGMQGSEYLSQEDRNTESGSIIQRRSEHDLAVSAWLKARDEAVKHAIILNTIGATKQLCNRFLEPWMWTVEVVTFTEVENFFHLRCPQYQFDGNHRVKDMVFRSKKDAIKFFVKEEYQHSYEKATAMSNLEWLQYNKGQAEIHMMALAEAMWDCYQESKPKELQPGEWHIPYGDQIDEMEAHKLTSYMADYGGVHSSEITDYLKEQDIIKLKIATARAARTSYTVVGEEGKPHDYSKDIELHDRLLSSGHFSCFEHCAQAMTGEEIASNVKGTLATFVEKEGEIGIHERYVFDAVGQFVNGITPKGGSETFGWCHNLRGWKSYRSMIPNENRR